MTYMWNLKKQYKRTYLQNKNRLIDRKRTHSYQKGSKGQTRSMGFADTDRHMENK